MAQLTAAQIIAAGLELAGNTGLSSPALTWLRVWLDDLALKHSWRQLRTRYGPFDVASGAQYLDFGDAQATPALTGNTDDKILEIRRAMLAEAGNTGLKSEIFRVGDDDLEASEEPLWATDVAARPAQALVEPASAVSAYTSQYRWRFTFPSVVDRAYRLIVIAKKMPTALTASTQTPWYPNDQTMINFIAAKATFHQEDPRYADAMADVKFQVTQDAVVNTRRLGRQKIQLSRRVFVRGRR